MAAQFAPSRAEDEPQAGVPLHRRPLPRHIVRKKGGQPRRQDLCRCATRGLAPGDAGQFADGLVPGGDAALGVGGDHPDGQPGDQQRGVHLHVFDGLLRDPVPLHRRQAQPAAQADEQHGQAEQDDLHLQPAQGLVELGHVQTGDHIVAFARPVAVGKKAQHGPPLVVAVHHETLPVTGAARSLAHGAGGHHPGPDRKELAHRLEHAAVARGVVDAPGKRHRLAPGLGLGLGQVHLQGGAHAAVVAVGDHRALGVDQGQETQFRVLGQVVDHPLGMDVPLLVVPEVRAQVVEIGGPRPGMEHLHEGGRLLQHGAGHQPPFQPEVVKGKGDHDDHEKACGRGQQPGGGEEKSGSGESFEHGFHTLPLQGSVQARATRNRRWPTAGSVVCRPTG